MKFLERTSLQNQVKVVGITAIFFWFAVTEGWELHSQEMPQKSIW